MARTIPEPATHNGSSSAASSRSRRRTDCLSLPFSSHPLYQLRRITLIIAIIGAILCFLGGSYSYRYGGPIESSITLLLLSAFFCALDLICWARKKKDNPDEDPERPSGKYAVIDLIMAILLQVVFWSSMDFSDYVYGYRMSIIAAYGILADMICSILHAICFWKQLMAAKEQRWLLKLERQPCARCGYLEEHDSSEADGHQARDEHPNMFPYAGPSADFGRAHVLTPSSPESTMEEGLLIGSDFGSGYGSVERNEPVLESPEEVVVGKGKKKAKGSGGQKSSTKPSIS